MPDEAPVMRTTLLVIVHLVRSRVEESRNVNIRLEGVKTIPR